MSDEAKPPGVLEIQGTRLWKSVASEAKDLSVTLDAMDLEQLFSACRLRDTIAALEERLEGMDLVIPGSREQWVANPLLTEIRLHRQLVSQTLARLKFPSEESSAVPVFGVKVNQHRDAGQKRWRQ